MAGKGTTPASSGVFSVAIQPKKYGSDSYDPNALSWFRTRAPRVKFSAEEMQDMLPNEVGGIIVPTGAFKSGAFMAGDVELMPRLEGMLGILLYGAMGYMQTGVNQVWDKTTNAFVSGTTGVNTHRFTYDPSSSYSQPWLSARVMTPGPTPDKNMGEVGIDMKVAAIQFNIQAASLLGASVSLMGLKPQYAVPANVNSWSYANALENSDSIPHAGKGTALVNGVSYSITQLSVTIANNMDPRQQMVIGNYHPDDLVALNRSVQLRMVVKWTDSDLYKQIRTGGVNNVNWDAIPFIQSTTGGTKAFEANFQSPTNIPGTAVPYKLEFIANRTVWQIDRQGIQLSGGDIIMVPYIGTVLEPATGSEYFELLLTNAATYTIPTDSNTPVFSFASTAAFSGTALTLDSGATFTDDDANLNGGALNVTFVGGDNFLSTSDKIQLGAGASFSGNNVLVGATVIGTVSYGAPDAGENLGISLTSLATPTLLQTFLRALQYTATAARSGDKVAIRVTIADGDGAYTSKTITVTHS